MAIIMAGKGGFRWNPIGSMNPAYKGGLITDKEWFYNNYIIMKMTLLEISVKAECSLRTAARWADIHEIKKRTAKESKAIRGGSYGIKNPNWKGGGPFCSSCGKKITHGKTRCKSCHGLTKRGANNSNYKGIANIMACVRQYTKNTWTNKIFARDGYTCQLCGDDKGGNLHAHHIRRLAVVVNDAINGLDISTEHLRIAAIKQAVNDSTVNNLDNGVTLCVNCHKEIHKGRREDIITVHRRM